VRLVLLIKGCPLEREIVRGGTGGDDEEAVSLLQFENPERVVARSEQEITYG
jgi:hypothetical protein